MQGRNRPEDSCNSRGPVMRHPATLGSSPPGHDRVNGSDVWEKLCPEVAENCLIKRASSLLRDVLLASAALADARMILEPSTILAA